VLQLISQNAIREKASIGKLLIEIAQMSNKHDN
jgi:hypothetical protein